MAGATLAAVRYLDFDLCVERAGQRYRARVQDSPAGEASCEFSLPGSDLERQQFLAQIGRFQPEPSEDTHRKRLEQFHAVRRFGGGLYQAVFCEGVGERFRASLDEAAREAAGLRIRLRLADAPELTDLPWEFLYDPSLNRFFCLARETPLVRYLDLPARVRPLAVQPPLRVLVVISSPTDYPRLDVAQEWQRLDSALLELQEDGRVHLDRLEEATLAALQRRLRRNEYHVFHFVGHGGFDDRTQDGVLIMEDETERGRPVSAQHLGFLLHNHPSLRLAILNACEGGRTSRTDPFAGTAPRLIQQGIPAVIAMQFEITDQAAIALAHEFYGAVADGFPLDAALAEARLAILDQSSGVEWATPVLYMRAASGEVFDITPPTPGERWHTLVGTRSAPPPTNGPPVGVVALPQTTDEPAHTPTPEVSGRPITSGRANYLWGLAAIMLLLGGLLTVASGLDLTRLFEAVGIAVPTPDPKPPTRAPVPGLRRARVAELRGHGGAVWGLGFSRDGRRLVSTANAAPWALVWDVVSYQGRGSYGGHASPITAAVWDTGQWLDSVATSSVDGTLRLWDPTSGRDNLQQPLRGHRGPVWAAAWAPGGGLLASAGDDATVRVWAPGSNQPARPLETGHGAGYAVAWAQLGQDARFLAAGAQDGAVVVWDTATWQRRAEFGGHQGAVRALAWSPEAQLLASGSEDRTARLWNVRDGTSWELRGHEAPIRAVAWSPDGQLLATASDDATVRIWFARPDGLGLADNLSQVQAITALAWARTESASLLAVGREDGRVDLWELPR